MAMLGRTANGVFWMARYLERAENTARLLEAGFRMALTRDLAASQDEWRSVITTVGATQAYEAVHGADYAGDKVWNFLLRDRANPGSVLAMIEGARTNARAVRTALTREVWEAVNESWMALKDALARPVREAVLGDVLAAIRRQMTLVRGAMDGTMLRNEIHNFTRMGTFIERADNTARILDVKYYVLLPAVSQVGSSIDNVQWESILRSVSAHRSYGWVYDGEYKPSNIADFLILNRRMPRSLASCYENISRFLDQIGDAYNRHGPAQRQARKTLANLSNTRIDDVFVHGLHEFIEEFITENNRLGNTIFEQYLQ